MSELNIIKYSEWDAQDLDSELRLLYIEIGRMGRDASDNINKIRDMEAELVNRKIKRIASEADIKRADGKLQTEQLINNCEETSFLVKRIEKYKNLLNEIKSIYTNKKEVNSLNAVETGILTSINEIL